MTVRHKVTRPETLNATPGCRGVPLCAFQPVRLLAFLLPVFASMLWATAAAEWHRAEEAMMGTRVSVEVWHENAAQGRAAVEAVMAEYRRIDENMSTYRDDSEISGVNRKAARSAVHISEPLFEVIEKAMMLSDLSDGAFDVTFDSVGQHYDFRAGIAPDDDAVARELPALDYRLVELNADTRTIRFLADGVRINLGGIAKGYAVERGAAIVREFGVRHALLNAGGDSRLVGDRRGQPWVVGIRDPRGDGDSDVIIRLGLVDEAISTSGDYERYFERDGERHHHILNPDTGRPADSLRSATVIGPDATVVDGLSTTVFVLGVEQGMQLIAQLDGYEAIVVDGEGALYYSAGLASPSE